MARCKKERKGGRSKKAAAARACDRRRADRPEEQDTHHMRLKPNGGESWKLHAARPKEGRRQGRPRSRRVLGAPGRRGLVAVARARPDPKGGANELLEKTRERAKKRGAAPRRTTEGGAGDRTSGWGSRSRRARRPGEAWARARGAEEDEGEREGEGCADTQTLARRSLLARRRRRRRRRRPTKAKGVLSCSRGPRYWDRWCVVRKERARRDVLRRKALSLSLSPLPLSLLSLWLKPPRSHSAALSFSRCPTASAPRPEATSKTTRPNPF